VDRSEEVKKKASPERFEHSRSKTNRLAELDKLVAGDPVNHSGKVTMSRENLEDIIICSAEWTSHRSLNFCFLSPKLDS
jgi:hypothetical protein